MMFLFSCVLLFGVRLGLFWCLCVVVSLLCYVFFWLAYFWAACVDVPFVEYLKCLLCGRFDSVDISFKEIGAEVPLRCGSSPSFVFSSLVFALR